MPLPQFRQIDDVSIGDLFKSQEAGFELLSEVVENSFYKFDIFTKNLSKQFGQLISFQKQILNSNKTLSENISSSNLILQDTILESFVELSENQKLQIEKLQNIDDTLNHRLQNINRNILEVKKVSKEGLNEEPHEIEHEQISLLRDIDKTLNRRLTNINRNILAVKKVLKDGVSDEELIQKQDESIFGIESITNSIDVMWMGIDSNQQKMIAMFAEFIDLQRDMIDMNEYRILGDRIRDDQNQPTSSPTTTPKDKKFDISNFIKNEGGPLQFTRSLVSGLISGGALTYIGSIIAKDMAKFITDDPEIQTAIGNITTGALGGGLLAKVLRQSPLKGAIAGAGVIIGQEIGEGIERYTGSDEFGDTVGNMVSASSIGFMIFGPKGALLAAVGAGLLTAGNKIREAIVERMEEVNEYVRKETEKMTGKLNEFSSIVNPGENFADKLNRGELSADQSKRARQSALSGLQDMTDLSAYGVDRARSGDLKEAANLIRDVLKTGRDSLIESASKSEALTPVDRQNAQQLLDLYSKTLTDLRGNPNFSNAVRGDPGFRDSVKALNDSIGQLKFILTKPVRIRGSDAIIKGSTADTELRGGIENDMLKNRLVRDNPTGKILSAGSTLVNVNATQQNITVMSPKTESTTNVVNVKNNRTIMGDLNPRTSDSFSKANDMLGVGF